MHIKLRQKVSLPLKHGHEPGDKETDNGWKHCDHKSGVIVHNQCALNVWTSILFSSLLGTPVDFTMVGPIRSKLSQLIGRTKYVCARFHALFDFCRCNPIIALIPGVLFNGLAPTNNGEWPSFQTVSDDRFTQFSVEFVHWLRLNVCVAGGVVFFSFAFHLSIRHVTRTNWSLFVKNTCQTRVQPLTKLHFSLCSLLLPNSHEKWMKHSIFNI